MQQIEIDAYAPAHIAARVEKVGVTKGNLDFWSTFMLAVLAGVFISFGAVFCTYVIHDSTLSVSLTKLLGGLVFCIGLILVVVAGAELFTGNNFLVMAFASKKITLQQLMRNWTIVFIGNLVGSLLIVFLLAMCGQWTEGSCGVGLKALAIANAKVNLGISTAFFRGILCNMLVCLAVWLCFSCRSTTDKILSILFPITMFVAMGFEHSVANMYFIPAGLVLKGNSQITAAIAASGKPMDLSNLTVGGFLFKNLIPVTLGNIVGGAILVGVIYWFIYLRPAKQQQENK